MRTQLLRTAASLAVLALIAACDSPPAQSDTPLVELDEAKATPAREPYTSTFEVEVAGEVVGYLVSYEAIPAIAEVERSLPTGSHRILDLEFGEAGFVTPRGDVFRHNDHGSSDVIGNWTLLRGLSEFFGGAMPVRLNRLEIPVITTTAPG